MRKVLLAAAAVVGLAAGPVLAQTQDTMQNGVDSTVKSSPAAPRTDRAHKSTATPKSHIDDPAQAQAPAGSLGKDRLGNDRTKPNALQNGNEINNSQ